MTKKKKLESFTKYIRLDSPDGLCWSILQICPAFHIAPPLQSRNSVWKFSRPVKRTESYHEFEIPKKKGGTRSIQAPTGQLKIIQSSLNFILSNTWQPEDYVHGFVSKRSVISGAKMHIGKPYVFNIDLKDFFPSIKWDMVYRGLRRIQVPGPTASLICDLCTVPDSSIVQHAGYLPQGAPTSPILSNIACIEMDRKLKKLAKSWGLTYTRYADDISFSSYHNVYQEKGEFMLALMEIIKEEGFKLNDKKTRLMKRGARQEVTGLTVCEKVNIQRRWLKRFRAQVHRMEFQGFSLKEYRSAIGKANWVAQVRPDMVDLVFRVKTLKTRLP